MFVKPLTSYHVLTLKCTHERGEGGSVTLLGVLTSNNIYQSVLVNEFYHPVYVKLLHVILHQGMLVEKGIAVNT